MGGTQAAPEGPHRVTPLLRSPDQLCTVYQPIVELRTGSLAGYEALTRIADWPARSPRPWFEAAARAGLGGELEAVALRQALRARPDLPLGLFLSLNVDPAALDDAAVIQALLDEPDLHGLLLELTPGVNTQPEVPAALADLRARGALVAVDVVDAGLTDLLALDGVRPDVVQLAAALVRDVHGAPMRERLVRLVVHVAAELGAVTLARGVEHHDEARHLQQLGVSHGQGWLFGRARPGFLPPSAETCTWLGASWQELAERTTVRTLTVPVPVVVAHDADGQSAPAGGWRAALDDDGRLRGLLDPRGRSRPLHQLLRLRAGQDLRGAARRALHEGAGRAEADWGVALVFDEARQLVGVVPIARLMEAAWRLTDPARGGGP